MKKNLSRFICCLSLLSFTPSAYSAETESQYSQFQGRWEVSEVKCAESNGFISVQDVADLGKAKYFLNIQPENSPLSNSVEYIAHSTDCRMVRTVDIAFPSYQEFTLQVTSPETVAAGTGCHSLGFLLSGFFARLTEDQFLKHRAPHTYTYEIVDENTMLVGTGTEGAFQPITSKACVGGASPIQLKLLRYHSPADKAPEVQKAEKESLKRKVQSETIRDAETEAVNQEIADKEEATRTIIESAKASLEETKAKAGEKIEAATAEAKKAKTLADLNLEATVNKTRADDQLEKVRNEVSVTKIDADRKLAEQSQAIDQELEQLRLTVEKTKKEAEQIKAEAEQRLINERATAEKRKQDLQAQINREKEEADKRLANEEKARDQEHKAIDQRVAERSVHTEL